MDFAQTLIQKKRQRIDQTLKRVLTIPLVSIAILVVLVIIIFRLVTTGILKPLSLVESAIEKVAKDSFTPISYDKEKQDEITRLIASFNKMANELESRQEQLIQSRKLASIGTFTSGIAHELNNPLNNISITAESLKLTYQDIPEDQVSEMIDEILTQTDRASQVVKNLLEFSRTERPYLRNLYIRDVIERTLNLIKNQLVVARLRVEQQIAEGLPAIRGRRQDLQQALVNILLNAIQAMPGRRHHYNPGRPRALRLYPDRSIGYRHGNTARGPGTYFRSFLYHQDLRSGNRAGPVACLQHHTNPWGVHRGSK